MLQTYGRIFQIAVTFFLLFRFIENPPDMKSLLAAVFMAICGIASAQKVVNDPNAEPRSVTSFHSIQVSNAFEVLLVQTAEEGLAVSSNQKEDLPNIKTVVENGILKIWFDQKGNWFGKSRELKAYVSVKSLDEITAGGATNIKIDGTLNASNLTIHVSGASDLKGRLIVSNKLDVQASGASDLQITGSASNVVINARGASDVKGFEFSASTCQANASGASDINITVEKELSAEVSGASSVTYKGGAVVKDVKTSGSGNLTRKS